MNYTHTILTRHYASPFLLIRFSYKYGGGEGRGAKVELIGFVLAKQ